jgi:hypothetical protein
LMVSHEGLHKDSREVAGESSDSLTPCLTGAHA